MSFKIPLFKLNYDDRETAAVANVLDSKWLSTGPKCHEFEKNFSNALGIRNALTLSNCTVALHMALKLLNIKEGDEVICPSLTFVATINAIRYVNAIPVFADIISSTNLNIDPSDIEKKITSKTKAIIVMHFGGFPCKMDEIMSIAQKYHLRVVEDACHGPLSEYKGKKLGTIGDIGCFSFFSNKNMGTGEGGMLVTNDDSFFNRAKLLRSHGMTTMSYQRASGHATDYDVVEVGYNFRMDDMRAAIGIVQLEKLPSDLKLRENIRIKYVEQLSKIDWIEIPFSENSEFVSNYIFPIVIKNGSMAIRDEIREKLFNQGIQTSVHYPAVHNFSVYREFATNLPFTEYVTKCEITLPMYSSITEDEIGYIVSCLSKI